MYKNKGRIIKTTIIVLGLICIIQGIYIYNKIHPGSIEKEDISGFSSFVQEKFNKEQKNNWNNFDSFFNDDFFRNQNDPFKEMEDFHGRLRSMMEDTIGGSFDHSWNSWLDDRFTSNGNQVEFKTDETDREYIYILKIGQLKDNDIKIDINENGIAINGKFTQKLEKKDNNGQIIKQQERTQVISQNIPLPHDADYSKAEVKRDDNQIEIRIPKS